MDANGTPAVLGVGDRFQMDGAEIFGTFTVLEIEPCETDATRHVPHYRYRSEVAGESDWACAYDVSPA